MTTAVCRVCGNEVKVFVGALQPHENSEGTGSCRGGGSPAVAINNDPINPTHYTSHPSGVECVDITEHMTFCVGSAMKYLWRAGLKCNDAADARAKHIEDLKKGAWYIAREIARLEKAGVK